MEISSVTFKWNYKRDTKPELREESCDLARYFLFTAKLIESGGGRGFFRIIIQILSSLDLDQRLGAVSLKLPRRAGLG